jgi:hypothetical protein
MIIVYPVSADSFSIKHPDGPRVIEGGALWPEDSFTLRMLAHGELTIDPEKEFKGERHPKPKPPPGPSLGAAGTIPPKA